MSGVLTWLLHPPGSYVASFVVGVLTSVGAGLIRRRILKPRVKFWKTLSKIPAIPTIPTIPAVESSGFKYRVKFWNASWLWRRDILDVTISARLHVKDLFGTDSDSRNTFFIPLGYASLPRIYPRRARKRKLAKWRSTATHITTLQVTEIEELKEGRYAKLRDYLVKRMAQRDNTIRDKLAEVGGDTRRFIETDTQLLEHLLQLGTSPRGAGAWLEIVVAGYDSDSGTREIFPKLYYRNDLRDRKFPARHLGWRS